VLTRWRRALAEGHFAAPHAVACRLGIGDTGTECDDPDTLHPHHAQRWRLGVVAVEARVTQSADS
jgi:hypothetical protein